MLSLEMPVTVFAMNKANCNASWERFQKRVEERRLILENARSMNVKRLQQDVERISKREVEFAKKVFEEIVPVKITWDNKAWENLQAFVPVRIEPLDKKEVVEPVVVVEEEKAN